MNVWAERLERYDIFAAAEILAEISTQYMGRSPDDPAMESFWVLERPSSPPFSGGLKRPAPPVACLCPIRYPPAPMVAQAGDRGKLRSPRLLAP